MNTETLPSTDYESNLICGNVKAVKNANKRSDSMYFLPIEDIVIQEGYNVRVPTESYDEHLRSIAASMLAEGFHLDSPLSVYVAKLDGEDRAVLVRGHTRLKAVELANRQGAGITAVPVIFKSKATSPTELDLDLIKSNSGLHLTTYENAVVIKRLLNHGLEPHEIAKEAGFSIPYVETLVTLASAPAKLAKLVAYDEVSASLAVELIRKHGPVAAQRLAMEALERAKNAGHKQATVRNLPDAGFKRAVKKAATQLFEITEAITSDPGYANLADDTREKIEALLVGIRATKSAANTAASDSSESEGEGGA
ncbi:ParB/RepB/Spo0J family partition protein (plasmid) [Xanthomonas sontii]|uniref:ParB/RepB/Spo0J family partition protein n=1 Tax=Xanthomonas sontii TaxID=2650745 RepID=UPI003F852658